MTQKEKKTPKQIAAWIGIVLLLVLVISTLIVSCLSFPGSDKVFIVLVLCDIVVPLFMWLILRFASKNEQQKQESNTVGETKS